AAPEDAAEGAEVFLVQGGGSGGGQADQVVRRELVALGPLHQGAAGAAGAAGATLPAARSPGRRSAHERAQELLVAGLGLVGGQLGQVRLDGGPVAERDVALEGGYFGVERVGFLLVLSLRVDLLLGGGRLRRPGAQDGRGAAVEGELLELLQARALLRRLLAEVRLRHAEQLPRRGRFAFRLLRGAGGCLRRGADRRLRRGLRAAGVPREGQREQKHTEETAACHGVYLGE